MIEAKHLVKTYTSKSGTSTKALNDVSLKLQKKGMVFVLGKSGSGKSTLLNVLGGLDNIDSGEIIIKGKSSASFKQSHFDSYRNTYVGFIFQEYNILDDFTVGQNIALAMKLQNRKPTSEDINGILKQVDLDGLGDRKPNELSGGQKQRVAIARALIKNPQIIMADEPTGALDSATGIQIFDTLKKLSKDKLVLIVSHDREFSERYADRIIELKDGQIISDVENTNKKGGEEQSITCVGNEVIVKQDYELTSKDLKIINAFIKKNKKDIKIRSGSGSLSKSSFTNTKDDNIQMDTSGFSLIKSKLPLSHAFKMGTSALKHKKVKLVMTIFLSLVSFTMLGMSATIGFYNPSEASANAISQSNINFATFQKCAYAKNSAWGSPLPMNDKDKEEIEKQTGIETVDVYQLPGGRGSDFLYDIDESSNPRLVSSFSYNLLNSAVCVTEINAATYGVIKMEGHLPTNKDEIAIPTFVAELMRQCDCYKYDETTSERTKIEINEYKDIIEKEITISLCLEESESYEYKDYKVVGIYDTDFAYLDRRYASLWESGDNYYSNDRYNEFQSFVSYSLAGSVFVHQDVINGLKAKSITPTSFVGVMPNDTKTLKNVYNFAYKGYGLTQEEKGLASYAECAKYSLQDSISSSLRNVIGTFDMMKQIFLYVGLGFIVFSGLLLANFIANSITYQRKQIGILRAIGARGFDIFKIYMSESFVIAVANFILATVTSFSIVTFAILPNFTKAFNGVQLFSFGIIPVLLILGVSFISAFLATFIPVYHIAKRKPIDTIRLK